MTLIMQAWKLTALSYLLSVCSGSDITFTDDDVALEVDPVAIWKLEHGKESCLCRAGDSIVAVTLRIQGLW